MKNKLAADGIKLAKTVIDPDYSVLLFKNADINLTEAYLLDRVQRKEQISEEAVAMLRKRNLIEGRKSSLYTIKQKSDRKCKIVQILLLYKSYHFRYL